MTPIDFDMGGIEGHGDVGEVVDDSGIRPCAIADENAAKADVEAFRLNGSAGNIANNATEAAEGFARKGATGFSEDFILGEGNAVTAVVGGIPAVIARALEAVDGDKDGGRLRDDRDFVDAAGKRVEGLRKGDELAGEADEFGWDK